MICYIFIIVLLNNLYFYYYMSKQANDNDQQINVEISEEMAEGVYSNLALIAHSNTNLYLILFEFSQVFQKPK